MSAVDDAIKNAEFGSPTAWSDVTGKPTEFNPASHTHSLSNLVTSGAVSGDSVFFNGTDLVFGKPNVTDAQLPALAITDVFVVANAAARLALAGTVQRGDVAKQTDTGVSYFKLNTGDGSQESHWTIVYDADLVPGDVAIANNSFIVGDVTGYGSEKTASEVKTILALNNVDNYETASQAEAQAGVATNKFMTPLRVAQAITALVGVNKLNVVKLKTASQNISNNSTLANDIDLSSIPLAANKTYNIELTFNISCGGSGGFKWKFNAPSGSSGRIFSSRTTLFPNDTDIIAGYGQTSAEAFQFFHVCGFITTSGTAGNLDFQWSQNASNATNTTLLRGSSIKVQEV